MPEKIIRLDQYHFISANIYGKPSQNLKRDSKKSSIPSFDAVSPRYGSLSYRIWANRKALEEFAKDPLRSK